jgi:hypothetical protein
MTMRHAQRTLNLKRTAGTPFPKKPTPPLSLSIYLSISLSHTHTHTQ